MRKAHTERGAYSTKQGTGTCSPGPVDSTSASSGIPNPPLKQAPRHVLSPMGSQETVSTIAIYCSLTLYQALF